MPGLGRPLRVLLYADDMVLLSDTAAGLQTLLNALHTFCLASHLEVNVPKSEIVVFGASPWRPLPEAAGGPAPWHYAGSELPVSTSFKYLGIDLHSTRGVRAAVDRLRAAGLRAIWGMHRRCTNLA